MAPLLFWVAFGLIIVAAYLIASTICKLVWKDKIPHSKLLAFAALYTVMATVLTFLMFLASMLAFGR